MKITGIETMLIAIPLRKPISNSRRTLAAREYVVVRVHTDEGITGTGYTVEGSSVVFPASRDLLTPLLLGQDPFDTERLWDRMFKATLKVGRRGAVMRALSAIDIALWDVKGRALNTPLYKLFGAYTERVPAYLTCGYYRDGESYQEMADGIASLVERCGFKAVKIKVGALELKEEIERLATVRRTVGDAVEIMVDANCAWNDLAFARKIMRAFEEYRIGWFEEPVMPDNFRGSAELAALFETPIATGEQECTRWGFRDLIEHRAADILMPDVSVVGGITEWMRVAALASAYDLPVSSHAVQDVHIHLMAAIPNASVAEYFAREQDIMLFDDLLLEPLKVEGGYLAVPQRPGLGMDLNEQAVQRYRVA